MQSRLSIAWVAAVGAALLGLWLARPAPITALDVQQSRLSDAAPLPGPGRSLSQTFTARHNGLSSVEVQVVYYGQPDVAGGALTLKLWGPGNTLIADTVRQGLAHNARVRLDFAPVAASAGQTFRLEVLGSEPHDTTLWGYRLDGYWGGDLHQGDALVPGDLQFWAYYTYLWPDLVRDTARAVVGLAGLAVPLWLVLFVPGLLLLDILRPALFDQSRWARWGGALAFSLALLPLVWLWVTTLGLAWSRLALGAVYAVLGAVVAGRWVLSAVRAVLRQRVRVRAAAFPGTQPVPVRFASSRARQRLGRHDAAMALVLGASVVLRLLAARDLAVPAWVDSSHHAFVARLLSETGRVPATYGPLLEAGTLTYHVGVHIVLVVLDWFSPLNLTQTMLVAGQVLNGLMPLAIYAGTAALTGRRRAALIAAFYVGVVSFFPGYYATWGRYSQLLGLLLLAPAMGAVWTLLAAMDPRPAASSVRSPAVPGRLAAAAGILAAGVLLAHYRVFFFYLGFVALAGLVHARGGWRVVQWLGATALVGGLLALPWVGRLLAAAVLPLLGQPARLASDQSYNAFPLNYFTSLLERGALWLAGAAAAWGLLRREKVVWVVTLWVSVIFVLLNLGATTWLVNNNAWAISLFVPVAIVLGWGLDRWLTRARRLLAAPPTLAGTLSPRRRAARWGLGLALATAAAGLVAYAGAAGSRAQIGIINPVTVLTRSEDVAALDWVNANTPPDAVFLVNGWQWLGSSWTGTDGGAWIMGYTGRRSTLPPVTYGFGPSALQRAVRDRALAVSAIVDAGAPETLALLQAEGVTHVFIGARGGNLKPEMFVNSPHYQLLYRNGPAWVFAVTEP